MLLTLPWELPADLPWRVFTSPVEKWATQPSFVIGEYVFIALGLLALWHARSRGRAHVLAWIAALLAGTANDVIFMALPLVDNFWQAQATIMLTPRLPLYIPCVYVCFLYIPTVAAWRVGLAPLARATLTGLLGVALYAPYDVLGARFLWWTWHDTDAPIAARFLEVPMSSTLWVLVFTATFAWLLNRFVDRDPDVARPTAIKALLTVCGLASIVMVLQMTVLQQLDGGTPGPIALVTGLILYAAIAGRGLQQRSPSPPQRADRVLARGLCGYFAALALIIAFFDPATHQSASLHQTYGPCGVEAKDITGAIRHEFVCAEEYDEPWDFQCVDGPPPDMTDWYVVCGKAPASPTRDRAAVWLWCLLAAAAFFTALGGSRRSAPA